MTRKKDYIEKTEESIEVIKDAVSERNHEKHRFTPGPLLLAFLFGAVSLMCVLLLIGKITIPFPPDDDKDSSRPIGESIREISELATLEYDYTYIEEFKKSRELDFSFVDVDIPFTQKKFIASFDGTIKYGVNLKKIDEPEIDDVNKTITFSMPEIVLMSHEINFDSVKLWHKENNLFYPIQPNDTVEFEKENKARAEKQAIKRGIIEKVQDHTTSVITSFVHSLFPEYKDYKIVCEYPKQKTIKRISYKDEEN